MARDNQAFRIELHRILNERFNEEDLRLLCFHLDMDYGSVGGRGQEARTLELIRILDRRDQLSRLVEVGQDLRPDIEWPDASDRLGFDSWQPFEPEMILIPAGRFLMGSDPAKDKDARDIEQTQYNLYLLDYYIAKTPVTNAQYWVFVRATQCQPPEHWESETPPESKADHPVTWISWYDAMAYCKWLAQYTGKPYRLPSEAEWEKAARGTDGRIYPWGDEWDADRCNTIEGGIGEISQVGAYSTQGDSLYGCADMAGNVWEWTRSLYRTYPYDPADGREDVDAKGLRVVRGGSFLNSRILARCPYRPQYYPRHRKSYGFRVVVSPIL